MRAAGRATVRSRTRQRVRFGLKARPRWRTHARGHLASRAAAWPWRTRSPWRHRVRATAGCGVTRRRGSSGPCKRAHTRGRGGRRAALRRLNGGEVERRRSPGGLMDDRLDAVARRSRGRSRQCRMRGNVGGAVRGASFVTNSCGGDSFSLSSTPAVVALVSSSSLLPLLSPPLSSAFLPLGGGGWGNGKIPEVARV